MLLYCENIIKDFPVGRGETFRALNGVSLQVKEGTLNMLMGRSGSGKTTLLNILSALDYPTKGRVFFEDAEISAKKEAEREMLRRHKMGYVFQSVGLLPIMNAYENVDFMLRLAGYEKDRDKRVKEVLKSVKLSERMLHTPSELSGGEQQRVAIARAIAHKPKLLFADEPTGALDTATGFGVIKVFRDLVEKEGTTIIMTTHDPNLRELADQVWEMEDGEIVGAEESTD